MIQISRIIVTSALPYVYSIPHLGNFVGSVLPADIYTNYLRMKGEDVIFICGSDVHGAAIEVEAIRQKTTPEEIAKKMHSLIKELFEKYGCNFSYYGSTHTRQNQEVTDMLFDGLYKNGYIGETEKELPYCNFDKIYLADRFIEGKCPVCGYESARGDQCDNCSSLLEPQQLIDPYCTICKKRDIVFKKAKNLTIRLDKLQPKLEKFAAGAQKNNWSKNAINETKKYFREGLKERDISRHTKWGFPIPLKGFEDQRYYVWFDAPCGYSGITKEWDERKWRDYWFSKDAKLVQFMGKDNIIFHTLLWPAMIIGADIGHVIVHTVKASEFLNWEGKKFSKSRGIGMDLQEAISVVKDPDYWRFALVLSAPENADTDFTAAGFEEAVNKILNGKIGNLFQRVFTLIRNNNEIFDAGAGVDQVVSDEADSLIKKYNESFDLLEFREALKTVVEIVDLGNAYMSDKSPWITAKSAKTDDGAAKEFSIVLNTVAKISYYAGILLFPFIPASSRRALEYFGFGKDPTLADLRKKPILDLKMEPKPIFEKLTEAQIKKIGSYS